MSSNFVAILIFLRTNKKRNKVTESTAETYTREMQLQLRKQLDRGIIRKPRMILSAFYRHHNRKQQRCGVTRQGDHGSLYSMDIQVFDMVL